MEAGVEVIFFGAEDGVPKVNFGASVVVTFVVVAAGAELAPKVNGLEDLEASDERAGAGPAPVEAEGTAGLDATPKLNFNGAELVDEVDAVAVDGSVEAGSAVLPNVNDVVDEMG